MHYQLAGTRYVVFTEEHFSLMCYLLTFNLATELTLCIN